MRTLVLILAASFVPAVANADGVCSDSARRDLVAKVNASSAAMADLDITTEEDLAAGERVAKSLHAASATLTSCWGPGAAVPDADAIRAAKDAQDAADTLESQVTHERDCRASDECMAGRVCDALFTKSQADAQVQGLKDQIATEKSNPAGVVDLVLLHNLGNGLRQAQGEASAAAADVARARAQFATYRHKAPRTCPAQSSSGS